MVRQTHDACVAFLLLFLLLLSFLITNPNFYRSWFFSTNRVRVCSSQWSTMKQMVADADTSFLPQEIVINILKRLPVKSLIRFQCVCKQWKNLFKTPSFIAGHLHHHSDQNPSLLFQQHGRADPLYSFLLDCEMQVRDVQNVPSIGSLSGVRIIGSSNGLLCVEIHEYGISPPSILLWNPAIREVRRVPRTINDFEGDSSLGFGFSPIVNDYKIVRTYAKSGGVVNRVEVYSLNRGSWKEIQFGNLEGVSLVFPSLTTNGTIFWHGVKLVVEEEDEYNIGSIVSFDIAMEVFTLIPMRAFDPNSRARLTVYENKLAVLSVTVIGDFESSSINFWVLEDGSGASEKRWCWIKQYNGSPHPYLLRPGTVWRNEIVCNFDVMPRSLKLMIQCGLISETEHVVENDEPRSVLFLSNLNTNEFKMFAIRKLGHGLRMFNYVESLVPAGSTNMEEPRP